MREILKNVIVKNELGFEINSLIIFFLNVFIIQGDNSSEVL
jgi:hypothetical protein